VAVPRHPVNYDASVEIPRSSRRRTDAVRQQTEAPELKIGWHGIGEGALADKAGVVEVARTLERAGFESAWIGEHPVLVDPQTPPSPVDPSTDLIDPMVALTAAAAVTERLILGAGVLLLPLHEPLALAK